MSSAALPRIFVTVPCVEDLESVIVLLRAAGAEITDQHREFVIEGPLTPEQAIAAWRLSRHRDHNSEGNQLTLRIDPGGDLEAALAVLCPQGYDHTSSAPLDRSGDSHRWWAQQQQRQREMSTRRPARVTPAVEREPVSSTKTEAVCCGQGGAWAPPPGRPVVIGCMLCPRSSTYWRTNRADGQPYASVRALGSDRICSGREPRALSASNFGLATRTPGGRGPTTSADPACPTCGATRRRPPPG